MTGPHEEILALLRGTLAAAGRLDGEPGLYMLCLHHGLPSLERTPIPAGIWGGDRSVIRLGIMARVMTENPGLVDFSPTPLAADFYGAAFLYEAWTVVSHRGDPGLEGKIAAYRQGTLHARPDRERARVMAAVDRAGVRYQAACTPDGSELANAFVPGQPHSGFYFGGKCFDALADIVSVTAGITLPPAPEVPGWFREAGGG